MKIKNTVTQSEESIRREQMNFFRLKTMRCNFKFLFFFLLGLDTRFGGDHWGNKKNLKIKP